MKSLIGLYQGVGKGVQKSMNTYVPFLLDGPKPPTWQTPGRLQYYRAENLIFLPDEVKWKLQMPQEVAIRSESLMYNDKVQDEILKFMGESIKYDFLQGNRDVNLDLTVSEATKLYNTPVAIREMAEGGKLQDLHQRCRDQAKAVENNYIKVMDQLDKTLHAVCEAEQDIYDELIDSDIEGLKRLDNGQQGSTIFNIVSFMDGLTPLENYEIVRRVADQKGDSDVVLAEQNLRALLSTRAHIMKAKATVQTEILAKISGGDLGLTEQELQEYKDIADRYGIASEEQEENYDVNFKHLNDIIAGDMTNLLSDIDACHQSQEERKAIYAEDFQDSDVDLGFRETLLKHLAGSIVIKEHRIRYQKEQFDRFVLSLTYHDLKKTEVSLREFSHYYSRMMHGHTMSSHNFRCHKIDANYDDFGEQTIKPLNATIFFYFFSANRRGKTWAQWMLSSARYPNDRMRRAYMRFFA